MFELPLLNTVGCVVKMAVQVKTLLYVLDLVKVNLLEFFYGLLPLAKDDLFILFYGLLPLNLDTQMIKYTTSDKNSDEFYQ